MLSFTVWSTTSVLYPTEEHAALDAATPYVFLTDARMTDRDSLKVKRLIKIMNIAKYVAICASTISLFDHPINHQYIYCAKNIYIDVLHVCTIIACKRNTSCS